MQGALKISEGSNLAIHALSYLAAVPRGQVTSVARMAEVLYVSRDHLGKVMQRLTRVGLVTSRRGPKGGFALGLKPKEVNLLQVVEAIDGPVSLAQCFSSEGSCVQFEKCNLKSPLQRLNDIVIQIMSQVSIAHLVEEEFRDFVSLSPG